MSLATRCTSCGTIFRVVQDQLKVSDGWVRCGRCDAVFSAANELFDLEHEAPPDWQQTPAPSLPQPDETAEGGGDEAGFASDDERRWSESMALQQVATAGSDAPEPVLPIPVAARPPPTPGSADRSPNHIIGIGQAGGASSLDAAADDDNNNLIFGAGSPLQQPPRDTAATDEAPSLLLPRRRDAAPPADADTAPGFLRQARRDAVWQSRRTRALLGGAALLLIALLALQALQQFSELAAARSPALRPALAGWCGLTGCSLAPPHRIDDIVVESTALSPAATGLRLAVTLRNRAGYPVAVPSIDLSMTDMSGKLIARRALSPHDLSVAASAIEAGSDLPLQALLTSSGERVSGYTVEIFYP